MRRLSALLACLVLLASRTDAALADTAPDAAALRESVRIAEHAPSSYRETIVIVSSDGTTTTQRRFVRGEDERIVDDDGTFHDEQGTAGGVHWLQNANGQTVVDRPDPGHAAAERMTTTVSAVGAPPSAYVIATLNGKGWGRRDFIDARTSQIVRRERIRANGTIITTYGDVRDERGRVFAHHWRIDDPIERTTSDARVTEYEPGNVSADEVARPPTRRMLVTFPPGSGAVTLPARFDRHIYVRTTIGNRGLDFVLDTGASGITLDGKIARELGLPLHGEHGNVVASATTFARAVIPELRVGALALRDVAVTTAALGWKEGSNVRLAGLLGYDFLAQLGVTIDYEAQRVTVVPSAAFTPPNGRGTAALDIRLGRGIPMVTASFDGTVAERVALDTGGIGAFVLFDYFTRRNPTALRNPNGLAFTGDPQLAGVGGRFATAPAFVSRFELANFTLRNVSGYRLTSDRAYPIDADGVIGEALLRYFTVTLDYPNERVYLTPNSEGRTVLGL